MGSVTVRQLLDAPVVRTLRKRRYDSLFARPSGIGCYRGVFGTFDEAAASAPAGVPVGYDTPESATLYRDRCSRVYPSDYPMLFWMRDILPYCREVFDFGGHVGVTYYAYGSLLRYPADLRWTVSDVPKVIEAGSALARERGAAGLRFTSGFELASGTNLLIAAGSLQYVEPRLDQLLGGLAALPAHILINKTPTHETRTFVTLQNIGVTYCPYLIFQREAIPRSLQALGYELVDTWQTPDMRCEVPFDA
ncbi:MAG: TIGR04325 family methyltransferase, partial [Gemmatimonadaceae bacterium]